MTSRVHVHVSSASCIVREASGDRFPWMSIYVCVCEYVRAYRVYARRRRTRVPARNWRKSFQITLRIREMRTIRHNIVETATVRDIFFCAGGFLIVQLLTDLRKSRFFWSRAHYSILKVSKIRTVVSGYPIYANASSCRICKHAKVKVTRECVVVTLIYLPTCLAVSADDVSSTSRIFLCHGTRSDQTISRIVRTLDLATREEFCRSDCSARARAALESI